MKAPYVKPVFLKRERLSTVAAEVPFSPGDINASAPV